MFAKRTMLSCALQWSSTALQHTQQRIESPAENYNYNHKHIVKLLSLTVSIKALPGGQNFLFYSYYFLSGSKNE